MRLFVALEVPEVERRRLAEPGRRTDWFGLEAGNLSWVRPENLHVTLKFLGAVSDERVPEVCRSLAEVARPGRLELHVDGVTFFPPRGPIRVFVARLGGDIERLHTLQAGIEQALEPMGFPREQRAYTPHVTLARARRDRRVAGAVRQLIEKRPMAAGA